MSKDFQKPAAGIMENTLGDAPTDDFMKPRTRKKVERPNKKDSTKKETKQEPKKRTEPKKETIQRAQLVNVHDIKLERGQVISWEGGEWHVKTEKKSERMQLLMRPSVRKGIKELAKKRGTTFNDLADEIFDEYLKRNK